MSVQFKLVDHNSEAWVQAVKLREEILRKPLGGVFSKEELNEEMNHHHVVGYLDDELIATAVLVPEGDQMKMQRVVVSDAWRKHNIGSELMEFCEEYTRSKGHSLMYCHARHTAVNFYRKNGYSGTGGYFEEDGIPHLKMSKML
jgi:predicted GNAT family N-acyltransferase